MHSLNYVSNVVCESCFFDDLSVHSSVKWSVKYCYNVKLSFEAE